MTTHGHHAEAECRAVLRTLPLILEDRRDIVRQIVDAIRAGDTLALPVLRKTAQRMMPDYYSDVPGEHITHRVLSCAAHLGTADRYRADVLLVCAVAWSLSVDGSSPADAAESARLELAEMRAQARDVAELDGLAWSDPPVVVEVTAEEAAALPGVAEALGRAGRVLLVVALVSGS
jgi:plasmid stability protein